ncbi:MAG: dihydrodipicolinate synthase family protein [Nitrososphaerales archaeon]|jgi:4-hydroxy-tetrahydrodipicolinate synthase
MPEPLAGTFPVIVTPLDDQRNQDEDSYRGLIEYYCRAGVKGLTILGEAAERDLLSEEERQRILTTTFGLTSGKMPIVVGTGNENLQLTVQSSISAQGLGASAVMIPAPRSLKTKTGIPNEDAIFDYFSSVGDAIEIPLVIQDFPQTDRPKMSPMLISRLNREISNAKYLKLEDPPTPLKLAMIREIAGDRLKIFSAFYGRDSFWDLVHGAVGIMTSSPTPEYLVAMYDAYVAGDLKKAFDIYLNTLPLVYYCSELGLAVRKEILVKRGVIRTSKMKLPEKELVDSQKRELADVLRWVEKTVQSSSGVAPLNFLSVP